MDTFSVMMIVLMVMLVTWVLFFIGMSIHKDVKEAIVYAVVVVALAFLIVIGFLVV